MPVRAASYELGIEFVSGSYTNVTDDCYRASIDRNAATLNDGLTAGAASFLMDNNTGKYSPANTASPLYNFLDPGRRVRLRASYLADHMTYVVPANCKVMALCDDTAETVTGAELVDNGTFSGGTAGWAGSGATIAIVAGDLEITSTGGVSGLARAYNTDFTGLTVGATYLASAICRKGTGTLAGITIFGIESATTDSATDVVVMFTFIATSTTHQIQCFTSPTVGHTAYFDDVSCRRADADISGNDNGLQVYGSITKAAAATNSTTVGYSGFSASNYLYQPYNSALDFGTADFHIAAWYKSSAGAVEVIASRAYYSGAYSGSAIQLFYNKPSSAMLFRISDDALATNDYVLSTTDPADNVWHFVFAQRASGYIQIYIDGVYQAQTAIAAALLSLTNTSADLLIGQYHGGGYPPSGSLDGFRIGTGSFTADEIRDMYEKERYMFTSTTVDVFNGTIKRYSVQPVIGPRTTLIECEDQVGRVLDTELNLSLLTNTNPASLFTSIMSACNVASFSVSSFSDSIPYAHYANIKAATALDALTREGAYWVDNGPDNTIHIRNRHFNVRGTVVSSYAEMFGLTYEINDSSVVNAVRVTAAGRKLDTSISTIAWVDPDSVTLAGSSSTTFWLSYVDPINTTEAAPASGVITAITSDYKFFTGAGATGTDRTSSTSVALTAFSGSAKLVVDNNSTDVIYFSKMQLRGYSIRALPNYAKVTEDSSSQALYRKHEQTYENESLVDPDYTNNYAQFILLNKKDPREEVSLSLKNIYPDILNTEMGDLLHINESITGLAERWTVLGVNHDINLSNGIEHATTYKLERWNYSDTFILDTSSLNVGRLGF